MGCQATNLPEDPLANSQGALEYYPEAASIPTAYAAAAELSEAKDSAEEASARGEDYSAEELLVVAVVD